MKIHILVPLLSFLLLTLHASAGDDKAAARLKELQSCVGKREFQDDKLRRDILTFCREQVGTPLYPKAIDALAACPSPFDKLDADAIDAEDRKILAIRELVAFFRPHDRALTHVAISFDGGFLASSGWDNSVHIHKLGGKEPKSWAKLNGSPSGIAFSPDGTQLATGGADEHVLVWDLTGAKPKQEHRLVGHRNRPFVLAYAPKGKMLASGCYGPMLRIRKFDDLTPEVWAVLANEGTALRGLSSLAFSHDGKMLVAGSYFGNDTLRVWDVAGKKLEERVVPGAQARTIVCSPTEPIIAFAGDDAPIHLWKIGGKEVEKLRKLSGHNGKALPPVVKALAFSPNGKALASGGQDKLVRLWDVTNGDKLREWQLPIEPRSLAFASDGRHLVIGNNDGTMYILRLESLKAKTD